MADIRSFDLNLLIALDALLDQLNVTRAAERLSLTQSTVSGMLARLREGLNDPLLVREGQRMIPTPRALELHPLVKAMLRDAEAILKPHVFDPAKADLTFTVSVNDFMLSAILTPFLKELRRGAPGIRLALVPMKIDGLEASMASGTIDLALTTSDFASLDLHQIPLGRTKYIGVARTGHPIHKERITVNRFISYDHVLVSPTGGGFYGPVDISLEMIGKKRKVAFSVPNFSVVPGLLTVDDLIAVVPDRLAITWGGALKTFKTPINVKSFETIVAWHKRSHSDPAHQWLRRSISKSVNSWRE